MKHLKSINENLSSDLYLIESDEGDHCSFVGMYDNIESFIKDMSERLLETDDYVKQYGLDHRIYQEDGSNVIKFTYGHSYDKYYYTKYTLNKLYIID